jgi:hypothetical protein
MALVLGANKLLAMAKDFGGFCFIVVTKCLFDLFVIPLFYNFKGRFKNTYAPIILKYRPLKAMRPSLLAFEPSSTYTLIGL